MTLANPHPLNFADEAHARNAYIDPTDPANTPLIGVTSVLSQGVPKPLTNWAAKVTAEYAVENLDAWRDLEPAAAVDLVKRAHTRARDKAGNRGSIVHRVMELHGNNQPPHEVFDGDALPYIEAGLQFLNDWQPKFHWIEATVFNPDPGYGGTIDWIGELDGGMWIVDYKTSKGVYGETGLQLAAYRYASHAVGPDHQRIPVPAVDGGLVIHLRGDGTYEVREVACGEAEYATFCSAFDITMFRRRKDVVAAAKPAPNNEPDLSERFAMLDERRIWLLDRVAAIKDAGMLDQLIRLWPEGVPSPKQGGWSDADIDAVAAVLPRLEHDLPFHDGDPARAADLPQPRDVEPADETLLRVAPDDDRIAAFRARANGLPDDVVAWLKAEWTGPRLNGGDLTEGQLADFGVLLAAAEAKAVFDGLPDGSAA